MLLRSARIIKLQFFIRIFLRLLNEASSSLAFCGSGVYLTMFLTENSVSFCTCQKVEIFQIIIC